MKLFQKKYRVESTRLPNWDYSSNGYYFVTICTKGLECVFGEIKNGVMGLSEIGCMVAGLWKDIPNHFNDVVLDEWVVMPNHVHGIIVLNGPPTSVETRDLASLHGLQLNKFGPLKKQSLQSVIHGFKSSVTRWCNENGHKHFAWQSLYYDRIIRNEKSLDAIREYIRNNPLKWEYDRNNPNYPWR